MRQGKCDTTSEAERVLIELCRNMTPAEKARRICSLYQSAKTVHAAGFRLHSPNATSEQIQDDWRRKMLGEKLYGELKEAERGSS